MDRLELLKNDGYWSSKLNTMLYHKNYKGRGRRQELLKEILSLKNELIELCERKKTEGKQWMLQECEFSDVADDIVKLFSIPDVRRLLPDPKQFKFSKVDHDGGGRGFYHKLSDSYFYKIEMNNMFTDDVIKNIEEGNYA